MKNVFAKCFFAFICCTILILPGCRNDSKSGVATTVVMQNKNRIPQNFIAINVLNQVIYLPRDFKKMEIPKQNSGAGTALIGAVLRNTTNPPTVGRYDVAVMFEKSADLRRIKPQEEEQVLELIFKNFWNSMNQTTKVATKRVFISKEICRNTDGHKYLKAVFVSGNPNKPLLDTNNRAAIYIFDDLIYYIMCGELAIQKDKYATEIDCILDTFGTSQ